MTATDRSDGLVDDFELDYIEMYVPDLREHSAEWQTRYGFEELADGGTPGQGFRSVVLGQGSIKLVLTEATSSRHPAAAYVDAHGAGIADIALRTADVSAAFGQIVERGGEAIAPPRTFPGGDITAVATVRGFGDVVHTLVQRQTHGPGLPYGYRPRIGPGQTSRPGFLETDHFAVCLPTGELGPAVAFYCGALGFEETFEERIVVGSQAMLSKVVQSRSRSVTLTMIQPDPAADPGQIDGFLTAHDGAGVQHVAFAVDDVVHSIRTLTARGVAFLDTPDAYYGRLGERLELKKHSLADLRELNILVDEDHGGQLFQIFTRTTHPRRTLFFEVIERFGAESFGSSNIKALYEAVELERAERAARS